MRTYDPPPLDQISAKQRGGHTFFLGEKILIIDFCDQKPLSNPTKLIEKPQNFRLRRTKILLQMLIHRVKKKSPASSNPPYKPS